MPLVDELREFSPPWSGGLPVGTDYVDAHASHCPGPRRDTYRVPATQVEAGNTKMTQASEPQFSCSPAERQLRE